MGNRPLEAYRASAEREKTRLPRAYHTPAWLRALAAALGHAGVNTKELVLAESRLLIVVKHVLDELEVTVQPRCKVREAWAETALFAVTYRGDRHLPPGLGRQLRAVARIIGALEEHIPAGLRGFAVVRGDGTVDQSNLIRRYPFVSLNQTWSPNGESLEVLVRTTRKCNQACPFCSAPTHRQPPHEAVLRCLQEIGETLPGAAVALTGGEPTLRKGFPAQVRAALRHPGIGHVQVQTNAVSFGIQGVPPGIEPTDRLSMFISLHAVDEHVYDRCTGSTGQLAHALAGIRVLLRAGFKITLNAVASSLNIDHLPQLAISIGGLLPLSPHLTLHLSVLICPPWNPRSEDYLAPYEQLLPKLRETQRIATASGVKVTSLLGSTHASPPPCLLLPEERASRLFAPIALPTDTGYENYQRAWVKRLDCASCREDQHCLGVPKAYAYRFGLGALRPMAGSCESEDSARRALSGTCSAC